MKDIKGIISSYGYHKGDAIEVDTVEEMLKENRVEFTPEAAKGVEWDDIEVSPIKESKDAKGNLFCEVCKPGEEDFWSVYLHLIEGGVTCIADLPTKKDAEMLESLLLYLTENSTKHEKRNLGKRK